MLTLPPVAKARTRGVGAAPVPASRARKPSGALAGHQPSGAWALAHWCWFATSPFFVSPLPLPPFFPSSLPSPFSPLPNGAPFLSW